ncbi:MAG: MgtC/SapB family protein [Bacteroidetes bacterium]|nr:MgtC/SapB family protein [Bacteroidota bacterium]
MEIHLDEIVQLLLSFIAGALIGFEREYRSKSAGLRTMILISVGSTLFTIVSIKIGEDPSRIAANVVTGIGFIGGGIIFREADKVLGITTAATVWVVAALGVCIGSGFYLIPAVAMGLLLFSLVVLNSFEKRFINYKNQARNYKIVFLYKDNILKQYEELFKEYGMSVKRGDQNRTGNKITSNWLLEGSEKEHEKLTNKLLHDMDILEMDF